MKKYLVGWMIFVACFVLVGCESGNVDNNDLSTGSNGEEVEEGSETMKIKMSVNGHHLTATLEKNASGEAFYELVKNGLTLYLSEYGGFEKVGAIGKTLPSNDTRINTKPGDLILYTSNHLSVMYGSNTWSYTKLGAIDHLDQLDLAAILGRDDVTIVFSI